MKARLPVLLALECLLLLAAAEALVAFTGLDFRLLRELLYYQALFPEAHRVSENVVLHYEHKPLSSAAGRGGVRAAINSLGFRGPEREAAKPAGVKRIICLGSSNTFGAEVGDEETYPAQLQKLLDLRYPGRYEVWNAGVNAYSVR